jgi:hypothetical protein
MPNAETSSGTTLSASYEMEHRVGLAAGEVGGAHRFMPPMMLGIGSSNFRDQSGVTEDAFFIEYWPPLPQRR